MQNVNIKPFNLIGIAIKTTNQNGQAAKEIPALWDRFMTENILSKIPNKINNNIYSLYTAYEGDHSKPYTTIIGCEVEHINNIPEGMTGKSFNGGNYIKITAKGDLTKGLIINEWHKIWNMNLERVYTADFEIYGDKAQNINDAEVDLFIAIK